MRSTRQIALAVQSLARECFTGAGVVSGVCVTVRPDEAQAALDAGQDVCLIIPPAVTFHTYDLATAEIEIYLVAASSDYWTAWEVLDALAGAVRVPLDLDKLRPAQYAAGPGKGLHSAYVATISYPID